MFFFLSLIVSCEKEIDYSITVDYSELTLKTGESYTIVAKVTPASSDGIVWTSSNESVATVFYGIITAKKEGEAIITATSNGESASCKVNVQNPGYSLVWSDEFETNSLNTKNWNIDIGNGNWGWGNGESEYYTGRTDNLRIENGVLVIQAKKENYQGFGYTSGRINSKNKIDFAYGKIEARISLPSGAGTWPAFWMLGYGSWPTCGEIDIMEHIGSNPTMISHALHTAEKNGGNSWSSRNYKVGIENNFHTYSIEWEKSIDDGDDCIKFYVDGNLTATKWQANNVDDVRQWPFTDNFYIILNLALGGTMGGTIDDTIFGNQILMKVDYVRVYQRK